MKNKVTKCVVIAAILVAVVIVVVSVKPSGEDASSERPADAAAVAPEGGAEGSGLEGPTGDEANSDIPEEDLEDIADELDTMVDDATDRVAEAAEAAKEEGPSIHDLILKTRVSAIDEMGIYHLMRDELKAKVLAKYGEVTPERSLEFVEVAKGIEERFWEERDFESQAALGELYEARALLEMSLEADPGNESLRRQYIEVLWAGWPIGHYKLQGNEAQRALWHWRHGYDLYTAILPLWEETLAKRETLTRKDLGHATDLLFWSWVKALEDYPEREAIIGELRKLDAPPSDEFLAFCENGGISGEKMLEIARRGAELAEKSGEKDVAKHFRKHEQWVKDADWKHDKDKPTFLLHMEPFDLYPSKYDWWSYTLGRGAGWSGPRSRDAKRMNPDDYTAYINEKVKEKLRPR